MRQELFAFWRFFVYPLCCIFYLNLRPHSVETRHATSLQRTANNFATDGARSVSTTTHKNTAANDKQSIGFFFVTFAPRGIVIAM
jgi:hypothetical protein